MKICESGGMPMEGPAMHGGHNPENTYCVYCADAKGALKDKKVVREGIICYMMKSEKKTREEAEKLVEEHMKRMPAWSRK